MAILLRDLFDRNIKAIGLEDASFPRQRQGCKAGPSGNADGDFRFLGRGRAAQADERRKRCSSPQIGHLTLQPVTTSTTVWPIGRSCPPARGRRLGGHWNLAPDGGRGRSWGRSWRRRRGMLSRRSHGAASAPSPPRLTRRLLRTFSRNTCENKLAVASEAGCTFRLA